MWGPGEASMWHEFQLLAARGMGVVLSNPRGSGGYGRAFQRANRMRWGDLPARDVLGALDHAADENGWIDESKLGVTGGSYAGYLTAWIVAHDDRFQAAVAQRGVYDLNTFFGEGNAWRLVPTHFGGYPWAGDDSVAYDPLVPSDRMNIAELMAGETASRLEALVYELSTLPQLDGIVIDSLAARLSPAARRLLESESPAALGYDLISTRELLARNSPLTYADQITTPLLIMHGSNDLRTGVIQSEMLYRTLKVLNRDVEYVRYPDAGHDLSRGGDPQQRLDRLLRIYEFLARHVE
jgi:dipeptidyl aminopeptidase/acylaminoacyl peptidase